MENERDFDVLIVYTDCIAKSAGDKSYQGQTPFINTPNRSSYNEAYACFLDVCRESGLKAALTTSADIIGAGTCKNYWLYKDKNWRRVNQPCHSRQIFDKFFPVDKRKIFERELLFSSSKIQPFNNAYLAELFFDKFETYKRLAKYTIPTVEINEASKSAIERALINLRLLTDQHLSSGDFTNAIVLKDRFGAGGNNIFKVTENFIDEIYKLIKENKNVRFILQPFLNFDKGFSYGNYSTATDIRLIYQNGEIIQTYIRMAKENDFRCNEHQGGQSLYVDLKDIPQKVLDMSADIARELEQYNSLFALDYIVSDLGNVYFLEGNIKPGIYWTLSSKKEEQMSFELITGIVEEIAYRVKQNELENIMSYGFNNYVFQSKFVIPSIAAIANIPTLEK